MRAVPYANIQLGGVLAPSITKIVRLRLTMTLRRSSRCSANGTQERGVALPGGCPTRGRTHRLIAVAFSDLTPDRTG